MRCEKSSPSPRFGKSQRNQPVNARGFFLEKVKEWRSLDVARAGLCQWREQPGEKS